MATYKIFAAQDATIYSDNETLNSGKDEILELTKEGSLFYTSHSTAARFLIKFSDTDINNVANNIIGSTNYKAFFKACLANADAIPVDYTIIANPLAQSWDMGTGKCHDYPIVSDGVSWVYRTANSTNPWTTASFGSNITGSYPSDNIGGGSWYYNYQATQSFGVYSEKDINIELTNDIKAMVSGSLTNNGFIFRTSGSLEFDENYEYTLNYFSRDTNTIYPPVLEFRWDDSVYNVTSSSLSLASSPDIRLTIANNKGLYNDDEIHRFRINVRDLYPTRAFATSSVYTVQKYLPSSSYYAVKDVKSDLTIVDFDTSYTKISSDTAGSYFDIYMNGLEPERYYKLILKTIISGSVLIFDDQYFFKVVE